MAIPNQSDRNDSRDPGILQPAPPLPPGQTPPGESLENYLQQYVAGLSHLDGTLVRPRWQPEPANLPDWGTDWAALGINSIRPIGIYGAVLYHPFANNGEGSAEMQRHEEFDVLVSFYGPHAEGYGNLLHDNLMVWQNKSALFLAGLAFVSIENINWVPELIRERWWNRYDVTLTMRRIVRRTYHVLNLLSASGWIITEGGYRSPWTTLRVPGPPIVTPPDHQHPIVNPLTGE
jgi:hypothetical protein